MGVLGNGCKTLTRLCSRRNLAASTQHQAHRLSVLTSGGRSGVYPPRWRFVHNSTSQKRIKELQDHAQELYPRVLYPESAISCRSFSEKFRNLPADESADAEQHVVLHGRVAAIRRAGSRLVFVDIVQDGHRVQTMCNVQRLDGENAASGFASIFRTLRRGDNLRVQGLPHRTSSGELSLLLDSIPELVSPCLAGMPTDLEDQETRIRLRHVDMLVHPRTAGLLRVRSEVITCIRQFLLADGHMEVQTPILAETAGGAAARPFLTSATEFTERKIALRIAPELWLKRLVVGGFDRVFEIGQSFRNEGIDLSHNPEFTTCEFYKAFVGLDDLMGMTEDMLCGLSSRVSTIPAVRSGAISLSAANFHGPYARIDFTEQLEALMGRKLPNLEDPNAPAEVRKLLEDLDLTIPELASLPQLLDRLSSYFLEPHCKEPTFIINHPECLAPLAKSFRHPSTGQLVSARAELFVNGKELINTYEEENSPTEQRRKFEDQIRYSKTGEVTHMDEGYLEALEWGLPPTGGWGGGIERICMALVDSNRISDFLSFGTLRNVVALGKASARS